MPVSLYMYSSDYLCRVRLIHCLAQEAECIYTAAMILQVQVFKLENVSTEVCNVHLFVASGNSLQKTVETVCSRSQKHWTK